MARLLTGVLGPRAGRVGRLWRRNRRRPGRLERAFAAAVAGSQAALWNPGAGCSSGQPGGFRRVELSWGVVQGSQASAQCTRT